MHALELDAHLVMLEQDRERITQQLVAARRTLRRAYATGTDEDVRDAGIVWGGLARTLDDIRVQIRRAAGARDLALGRVPGGRRITRPTPGGVYITKRRDARASRET
jgi:hypothetical protein